MSRITNLAPNIQPAPPSPFAGLIRMPGQLLCPDGIVFDELERAIRRHLFKQVLPSLKGRAERYLIIQGARGTGKTVSATDASLRYGFAVALLPASMLASEHEGGASAVLNDFMTFAAETSRARKARIAIVADDFDLSISAADSQTGKTINSLLVTHQLQQLADTQEPRNFDDSGMPVIFTGNNFTTMRTSLFRDGRATWHTHRPTLDDKLVIAFQLFNPRSFEDRRVIERLVRAYRDESVAFWRALHNDLMTDRLDDIIARSLPDVATAEAEFRRPVPLDGDKLWALARARAKTKPASFL
ncbi:MAG: hypothetical protein BGN89_19650 [Alphaproteobacteria bacterium 64-6]|uniref:AAA family ATPase n=1 Tax=Hyphomicrobium sp. CS1BSMeth3 TaxID=1892844 RepID=UPI00086D8610|nr:AAA family ATPase [Hyphomicrobium sp. CS1BSMeth3]MBN9261471.1 AAA family ATPase [Hyphomicrobium sp.]MBN9263821.1 AAA family ATPase [Hyphomicrobium sp.]ODT27194.1 MAG: hypothetical protein ABS54_06255 [Hyphomicrobium sp. SCN 65-11]OJU26884.1 MAG: hypothetical protein BGN89_19650 [Alphaproteobacteria bacterium 64-6]